MPDHLHQQSQPAAQLFGAPSRCPRGLCRYAHHSSHDIHTDRGASHSSPHRWNRRSDHRRFHHVVRTLSLIHIFATGVELMEHRGRYMGEAGRNEAGENIGTMAAAIGDRAKVLECVEKARGNGILVAANINAPTQTVVSGDRDAVERFTQIAKEARLRVCLLYTSRCV